MGISENDAWCQLCRLKPSKSGGPDGCSPRVFIELKDGLLRPLNLLFKKLQEESQLPISCKEADLTPIFKKGSRSLATNYYPVSLMSIVCKMLELEHFSADYKGNSCVPYRYINCIFGLHKIIIVNIF